jgi:hypothetical protein
MRHAVRHSALTEASERVKVLPGVYEKKATGGSTSEVALDSATTGCVCFARSADLLPGCVVRA